MWFRVTAERFDWMPRPGVMISYPHGHVGYGTRACVSRGVEIGAVEKIKRPDGYSVDKAGKVTRNA